MGFLGQELPGSIICDECTCSHMPMYNRRRTYLRLHMFAHPPLGRRSLWVNAHRSLPPVGGGMWFKNGLLGASGCRPRHKIPVHATIRRRAEGAARAKCSPAVPSHPWMGGRTSPGSFSERSPSSWPVLPVAEPSRGRGCSLGHSALSTPPACL